MTLPPALQRLLPFALIAAGVTAVAAAAIVLRSEPGQSAAPVERPTARSTPAGAGAGDTPPSTPEPGDAGSADSAAVQARDALASTTVDGFELVSVAPYDAIQAFFEPTFLSAAEADEQLLPRDLVLGVSVEGDHRAYGVAFLADHEVVNDVIGGVPLAVTW